MVFGKNLKKIRKVHSLSQQDFAELFDLKRATLGAYEENRSNPKLDTVIKIANHFSIGLENLLTKELTINDLLHFNEAMTTGTSIPSTPVFEGVACITPEVEQSFLKEYRTSNTIGSIYLPYIHLPNIGGIDRLAYVVNDLSMSGGAEKFLPKDVVIGEAVTSVKDPDISGQLVIAVSDNAIYLRTIYIQDEKAVLKANHPGVEPLTLECKKITGLWKILHVFRYTIPENSDKTEQRLAQLESMIAGMNKKH
ncbi:helix-turn-helix transcriptional regulator [Flavobacterium rhizosphaerae]|uniref:Helix-turn-helix transcriptional regulator n=1 Tax=Flavobacterium rhizosphaerae TaxID=3163298 RepID=A0ABW8YW05_9FLAO